MYGLSISQQDKIPGLLLKLSDLLRYSVYNTKQLFVPLTDELAYIRNYIDFEKIRIGDRLVLTTAIEDIPDAGIKIAPMVLIVFIENAFKHARDTLDQKIHINIAIKVVNNFILFTVRNSHRIIRYEHESGKGKSGLGLINTIKRLELLYLGEYNLDQQSEEKFYNVVLRLKVK
jgi:sensor histidine kinase YesM